MEKCFKVIEGSRYHKECVEYTQDREKINAAYKEFKETFGIEATKYAPRKESIYIEPTESDSEKFGKILNQTVGQGLQRFNKSSKPSKWWCEKMKEAGVKSTEKPFVPFWFPQMDGKMRSRLFPIDGVWYGSFDMDGEISVPEGLEEIKQSDFYKMIEDYNAKVGA